MHLPQSQVPWDRALGRLPEALPSADVAQDFAYMGYTVVSGDEEVMYKLEELSRMLPPTKAEEPPRPPPAPTRTASATPVPTAEEAARMQTHHQSQPLAPEPMKDLPSAKVELPQLQPRPIEAGHTGHSAGLGRSPQRPQREAPVKVEEPPPTLQALPPMMPNVGHRAPPAASQQQQHQPHQHQQQQQHFATSLPTSEASKRHPPSTTLPTPSSATSPVYSFQPGASLHLEPLHARTGVAPSHFQQPSSPPRSQQQQHVSMTQSERAARNGHAAHPAAQSQPNRGSFPSHQIGAATSAGRRSPNGLYSDATVTFPSSTVHQGGLPNREPNAQKQPRQDAAAGHPIMFGAAPARPEMSSTSSASSGRMPPQISRQGGSGITLPPISALHQPLPPPPPPHHPMHHRPFPTL